MAEAENNKLKSQVGTLSQENGWLRDKLADTQKKLRDSEQAARTKVEQVEAEIWCREFKNSIRQYDEEPPVDDENAKDRPKDVPVVDPSPVDEAEEQNAIWPSVCYDLVELMMDSSEIMPRRQICLDPIMHYNLKSSYEDAVSLCQQGLKNIKIKLLHYHSIVATSYCQLLLRNRRRKYREAVNFLNNALAICEKTLGENDPVVVKTLLCLVVLHTKFERYKEVETLGKRALEICEKAKGRDHLDVAELLDFISQSCYCQDKYAEAQMHYQRALEIYEAKLGSYHADIEVAKYNLAVCYHKQGKCKVAEVLYKEVLTRAHEKKFGPIGGDNKPIWQVAEEREEDKHRNNENASYGELGDWLKSAKFDSPEVIGALITLGTLYRRQGMDEAVKTFKIIMKLAEMKL